MDESWNRLSDDERHALGLYHQLESLQAMRDRGDLVPQLTVLKAALGSSHLELVFDSVINAADGEAHPAILQPLTVLLAALAPDGRWLLHYRLALAGYRESMLEVAGGFADAANQVSVACTLSAWKALSTEDSKLVRQSTHRMERLTALSIAWGAMAQGSCPLKKPADPSITVQANALAVEFQTRQWSSVRSDAELDGFQRAIAEGRSASLSETKGDEPDPLDDALDGSTHCSTKFVLVVLPSAPTFRDMDKGVRAIIGKPLPLIVAS